MSLLTQKPPPQLASYVHRYVSLNLSAESTLKIPNGSYRLPNSIIRMAFHFSETIPSVKINDNTVSQAKYHIRGYQFSPITFQTNAKLDVFSIEFTPFGFYNMFGISCSELEIVPIPLASILNKEYDMLVDELSLAKSFTERVDFMNSYFLRKTNPIIEVQKALQIERYISETEFIPTVKVLASKAFTTERTMRRYFKNYFGLSPKSYLRLKRFEQAVQSISKYNTDRFLEIAADFGYYDHAHLTNDFKFYMGVSPKKFQDNILKKQIRID